MIYALFPTHMEAEPFIGMAGCRRSPGLGGRPAFTGELGGSRVTALVCGVGQVNAAQAATAVFGSGYAGTLVLGGCAGAYRGSGLEPGDAAVATEEVYADLGVITPGGWLGMEAAGIPLAEEDAGGRYGRFALPGGIGAGRPNLSGEDMPRVRFGRFLTVCAVSGTAARGDELAARYDALCENMEGAAAAQVAAHYGFPLIEVRGISNIVEDRDRGCWDVPLASRSCARVLGRIIGGGGGGG